MKTIPVQYKTLDGNHFFDQNAAKAHQDLLIASQPFLVFTKTWTEGDPNTAYFIEHDPNVVFQLKETWMKALIAYGFLDFPKEDAASMIGAYFSSKDHLATNPKEKFEKSPARENLPAEAWNFFIQLHQRLNLTDELGREFTQIDHVVKATPAKLKSRGKSFNVQDIPNLFKKITTTFKELENNICHTENQKLNAIEPGFVTLSNIPSNVIVYNRSGDGLYSRVKSDFCSLINIFILSKPKLRKAFSLAAEQRNGKIGLNSADRYFIYGNTWDDIPRLIKGFPKPHRNFVLNVFNRLKSFKSISQYHMPSFTMESPTEFDLRNPFKEDIIVNRDGETQNHRRVFPKRGSRRQRIGSHRKSLQRVLAI
jgi:hypothetical protein